MIQVVTYSGNDDGYNGDGIEQYSLHDIRSLDEYDINVIDLDSSHLWVNEYRTTGSINKMDDLKSISKMISNSNSSNIVIILPQNKVFRCDKNPRYPRYEKQEELKNMLEDLTRNILSQMYQPISNIELVYENTKTFVEKNEIMASFYFTSGNKLLEETINNPVLRSIRSNKATVIKRKNVFLTTLCIEGYDALLAFLREIKLLMDNEEAPEWITDIKMFDDITQEQIISDCGAKIREAKQQIGNANLILEANNQLKTALYTNGDELVEIVFKILEELLDCDLSCFVDVKKEDVSFTIDGYTFIGEIKGINHNVKNQNISQLENHYQEYLDEHKDLEEKDIKALLIINHQRSKSIFDREPIMDTQIKLAKKYGSLIIETYTLLKLLEKYRAEELSRGEIIGLLKDNTGILKI